MMKIPRVFVVLVLLLVNTPHLAAIGESTQYPIWGGKAIGHYAGQTPAAISDFAQRSTDVQNDFVVAERVRLIALVSLGGGLMYTLSRPTSVEKIAMGLGVAAVAYVALVIVALW